MIKTITIDGKDVVFKSTAATPIRYKMQFGSEFFTDVLKLNKVITTISSVEDKNNLDLDVLTQIDFDMFYNIIWVFAKNADKSISDPITWLDSFDEFPIFDILNELMDLLLHTLGNSKKK
ncbi:hypothetical protein DFO70_11146 [Cytobacillus firmus]|uniref:Prophage pi2 protein 40 n=2 Tax=Cytobacillus TaxID=2675230 RepID=A0A366JN87_CYTFI|nr:MULTISPECIES: hypothetical protein [Cytobacillus]RBP89399.1 hypothetical protein DFO70_11146 [Cytobacillus firmus]TDX47374.1 hypothetical protein DFO72_101471 [Cytobacillus oceanisediminis]